jgi:hypothetical protein
MPALAAGKPWLRPSSEIGLSFRRIKRARIGTLGSVAAPNAHAKAQGRADLSRRSRSDPE